MSRGPPAKVDVTHALVGENVVAKAFGEHSPLMQNRDAVGNSPDEFHVVFDDEETVTRLQGMDRLDDGITSLSLRPAAGSSSRIRSGSPAITLAISTLWRMPWARDPTVECR